MDGDVLHDLDELSNYSTTDSSALANIVESIRRAMTLSDRDRADILRELECPDAGTPNGMSKVLQLQVAMILDQESLAATRRSCDRVADEISAQEQAIECKENEASKCTRRLEEYLVNLSTAKLSQEEESVRLSHLTESFAVVKSEAAKEGSLKSQLENEISTLKRLTELTGEGCAAEESKLKLSNKFQDRLTTAANAAAQQLMEIALQVENEEKHLKRLMEQSALVEQSLEEKNNELTAAQALREAAGVELATLQDMVTQSSDARDRARQVIDTKRCELDHLRRTLHSIDLVKPAKSLSERVKAESVIERSIAGSDVVLTNLFDQTRELSVQVSFLEAGLRDDRVELERLASRKLALESAVAKTETADASVAAQRAQICTDLLHDELRAAQRELHANIATVSKSKLEKEKVMARIVRESAKLDSVREAEVHAQEALLKRENEMAEIHAARTQLDAEKTTFKQSRIRHVCEINELKNMVKRITEEQAVVEGKGATVREAIAVREKELHLGHMAALVSGKEVHAIDVAIGKLKNVCANAGRNVRENRGKLGEARTSLAREQAEQDTRIEEYEQVIVDRDLLATQLVRRNDELALLIEKLRLVDSSINAIDGEIDGKERALAKLRLRDEEVRQRLVAMVKRVAEVQSTQMELDRLDAAVKDMNVNESAVLQRLEGDARSTRKLRAGPPRTLSELHEEEKQLRAELLKQSETYMDLQVELSEWENKLDAAMNVPTVPRSTPIASKSMQVENEIRSKVRRSKFLMSEVNLNRVEIDRNRALVDALVAEIESLETTLYEEEKQRELKRSLLEWR